MNATLIFNLDSIDERLSHLRAINADHAYSALYEIKELLRQYRKYGVAKMEQEDLIDFIEENVLNIINEKVNLDREYN